MKSPKPPSRNGLHLIGEKFGRIAEAMGGIGLIVIGAKILIEHTLLS